VTPTPQTWRIWSMHVHRDGVSMQSPMDSEQVVAPGDADEP
jgi:hypothetical protein